MWDCPPEPAADALVGQQTSRIRKTGPQDHWHCRLIFRYDPERNTASDHMRGKASLTLEMALRIGRAFGPDMEHLLRMQLAHDIAQTRHHPKGIAVKRYLAQRQSL